MCVIFAQSWSKVGPLNLDLPLPSFSAFIVSAYLSIAALELRGWMDVALDDADGSVSQDRRQRCQVNPCLGHAGRECLRLMSYSTNDKPVFSHTRHERRSAC